MVGKVGMETFAALASLVLSVLLSGCGNHLGDYSEDWSGNLVGILSPDGSQVAFVRHFDHNKVDRVTETSEHIYTATFIYTINRQTRELRRLAKVEHTLGWGNWVNISWEGNLIAYSVLHTLGTGVHIMNPDGRDKRHIVDSEKSMIASPVTLSGDCQKLFYIDKGWHDELEFATDNLYSTNLDGTSKSIVSDLYHPCEPDPLHQGCNIAGHGITDVMWNSDRNCILVISRDASPVAWEINPDGTGLKPSEQGLAEYNRRKIEYSYLILPLKTELRVELEELTQNITYAEWGVPEPD